MPFVLNAFPLALLLCFALQIGDLYAPCLTKLCFVRPRRGHLLAPQWGARASGASKQCFVRRIKNGFVRQAQGGGGKERDLRSTKRSFVQHRPNVLDVTVPGHSRTRQCFVRGTDKTKFCAALQNRFL